MFLRVYLSLVLFFGCTVIQCAFVQQYESQLLLQRFSAAIKKAIRFFYNSSDVNEQCGDTVIQNYSDAKEEKFFNNNSSINFDEQILIKMKKEFIRRVYLDEQGLLDKYFYEEYQEKYSFYSKKISQFQNNIDIDGDVLDVILSVKFDAIMKTLFIMVNREQAEEYGVFNEIFDIIRENNFIIDKKNFKPLLDKIIEIMQGEQRKVYYKTEGFVVGVVNFFTKKEEKKPKEDKFEKVFVRYGLNSQDSLLWDTLVDERRYDFHMRRIEDAGRQGAYSME